MASPSLKDGVVETNDWKYVGQVRPGVFISSSKKRHGYGVCTYKGALSGQRYEGEWKDEKRNGQGVMTWPDNKRYEGGW
jgi:hypothetical protein